MKYSVNVVVSNVITEDSCCLLINNMFATK